MRDLFEDLASSFDPVQATERARANMQRTLPKRFYSAVSVVEEEGAFRLLLDGKPVRTPGRNLLTVRSLKAAVALEAEWAGQGSHIDPATMPLTRLINAAIDGVSQTIEAVKDEIAAYAGTDLLCYRAAEPPRLAERQRAAWDPVLDRFAAHAGCRPAVTIGVMAVAEAPEIVAAVRAALPDDPARLAAMSQLTTLTGSVFLALALQAGELTADAAWAAAHIDEDWNAELWGADGEAQRRRAHRRGEFDAAMLLIG